MTGTSDGEPGAERDRNGCPATGLAQSTEGMETEMIERIPAGLVRLGAVMLMAIGSLAIGAAAASAHEAAYNNRNTVAATVNGHPNEDTYSLDYENYDSGGFGGMVEFGSTSKHALMGLTTQLDVFTCEHGVYSLENCVTLKPKKKFPMQWTANVYAVGPGNTVGSLIATSTATFKLNYRPTTNVGCPSTEEGRGFGVNCDVGGYLQTVRFKHFTPSTAPLPAKAIILLTAPTSPIVNVGLQASYKEFSGGQFVEEPAVGSPAVGSDPLPDEVFINGALTAGYAGAQPVFEVTVH